MKQKNSRKKKRWLWVLAGLVLVIAAGVVLLPSMMPAVAISNVESVIVAKGSIVETVVGTGSLESGVGDETEIKIPVGIRIDEVFVEIDDFITKGDFLATVDPLSLQHRITSIRSEIESLDSAIHTNRDNSGEETIRSNISGRVKKIYVETGDSVHDAMGEYGFLMLISTDEKMAVDVETTTELFVGETVNVIRENGSRRSGEISQVLNDGYIITLSDNGPGLDEVVEIQDRDGIFIGSGNLYLNQPISIVASSGTVKTIHVSENDSISRNRRLITLENVPLEAEFQQLLLDRSELVDHLNMLLLLSETHTILSTSDGTITNLSVFEDTITTASSTNTSSDDNLMTVAFVIEHDADVTFAIEVDELDILSIQMGQEATIMFNAIPDMQYTGSISEIASSSHSQSGVAKYFVEVSLTKDDSMRIGMNATATINISNRDDILVLPLTALQETAGNTFVYTERDVQTGALSGIKQVLTGVSDGMVVEIIDGLSEGDVVYYATRVSNVMVGFGPGGGMPGGGGVRGGISNGQRQQGGAD